MITKHIDDFIKDRDETFWAIQLSNGETIYEDDQRPGELSSAWVRLKKYLSGKDFYITGISLCFRKRKIQIFKDVDFSKVDGIFFSKSILGKFIYQEGARPSVYSYIFGLVYNNEVKCENWRVPEIIKETEMSRTVEECTNDINIGFTNSEETEYIKDAKIIWR